MFLLRALCVATERRRQGYARRLLCRSVVPWLDDTQSHCYCFPRPHLEALYQDAGFASLALGEEEEEEEDQSSPEWLPECLPSFARQEYRLVKKQNGGEVLFFGREAAGRYEEEEIRRTSGAGG